MWPLAEASKEIRRLNSPRSPGIVLRTLKRGCRHPKETGDGVMGKMLKIPAF